MKSLSEESTKVFNFNADLLKKQVKLRAALEGQIKYRLQYYLKDKDLEMQLDRQSLEQSRLSAN